MRQIRESVEVASRKITDLLKQLDDLSPGALGRRVSREDQRTARARHRRKRRRRRPRPPDLSRSRGASAPRPSRNSSTGFWGFPASR